MTTLGLLSDTHGRSETARDAVQLLLDNGADLLIHLGDIGSTQVLDALATHHPRQGRQIQAHIVFGNCDWDIPVLARYAADLGITAHDPTGLLEIDGKRVGFTHGHQGQVLQGLIDSGCDYVLHGHTHQVADTTRGPSRLINPGALFRARKHTVALLVPASGECRVIDLATARR